MKHIEDISALIQTLQKSTKFHILVVQSPPGWAKSTTVENELQKIGNLYHMLGAYATALQLYSAMYSHSKSTIVIDDTSGLFGQPAAMAILKAATWATTGSHGHRIVSWKSASDRVPAPSFTFDGKLILLTNSLPSGPDIEALLTRGLFLKLEFGGDEIEQMLLGAANDKEFYPDTELARSVASYLVQNFSERDKTRLNLRTLQVSYELALLNPNNWTTLLERLLPPTNPMVLVKKLGATGAPIEDQARNFERMTGLSRRTFFTYRGELGLRKLLKKKVQSALGCS